MDKNKICEALYALPGSVVVKHRKPLLFPGVLLVAGVAMIVLNNVFVAEISNNISSALVFVGGLAAAMGVVFLLARLFGSNGVPFHQGNRCYLHYDEFYFDRKVRTEVMQSVGEGNVKRLLEMEHAQVPALAVAVYRTPDNRFAAMQAFEYADLEYRPLTELKIVGEAASN
ncbi:MAG: hypothetical protein RR270_02930 [Alistipes sp.]